MIFFIAAIIIILSYMYGSFSTSRIVAKSFRSLNIYKVGSGLADTENIYTNVSKSLGILVGALDIAKSYVCLLIIEALMRTLARYDATNTMTTLYHGNMILVFGLSMLVGHCLPLTNKLRGGRGIFTYIGFIGYFAIYPMLITLVLAWVIVAFYRQIRFAQYLIVILPIPLIQIFYSHLPWFRKELPPHFTLNLLGIAILMALLNIIVSKRLGEF